MIIRRLSYAALAAVFIYFTAVRIVRYIPQGRLAWAVYVPLPYFDIIDGPREAWTHHRQRVGLDRYLHNIGPRARICDDCEIEYYQAVYDQLVLKGRMDVQNPFGAWLRMEFAAISDTTSPDKVRYVRLANGQFLE